MSSTILKATRCPNCKGQKTFQKIGGMGTRDCSQCKGIGYLTAEVKEKKEEAKREENKDAAPAERIKRAYNRKPVSIIDDVAADA
jgi:hypothetical protein